VGISVCLDLALNEDLTFSSLLGILVSWSTVGIDSGIKASLLQSYSILLSTLLIANPGQMCATDANYATIVTSPPLMVYLMISSILDLFGVKTDFYQRIRPHPRITRAFGALILPIWFSLSLIIGKSRRAFYNGIENKGCTFWWWLRFPMMLLTSPLGSICLVFPLFPVLFLYRRWSQVMADFRAYREKSYELRWKWCRLWWFVKCACAFTWYAHGTLPSSCVPGRPFLTPSRRIIDRNHRWFLHCVFVSLDCAWAYWVLILAGPLSWRAYALTYGQVRLPFLC